MKLVLIPVLKLHRQTTCIAWALLPALTTSPELNRVYPRTKSELCMLASHILLCCQRRSLGLDTASEEDPSELSFFKGEIMEIRDKNHKWWIATKADGSVGSESRT